MAEENKQVKPEKTKSPSLGSQAKPVPLSDIVTSNIDLNRTLTDGIIEAGLTGGLNIGALEAFTSITNARDQVYQLIDTMAADSSVSSIIRTYAEDVCDTADNGHVV